MSLDAGTVQMVADAFDETYDDALAAGHPAAVAKREGLTAAAMFLASLTGMEDEAARAGVEALNLNREEED